MKSTSRFLIPVFILILLFTHNAHPQFTPWKAVDTMDGTFSTAWPNLGPVVTAPYTPLTMVIHRANTTYAPSSGALVYNISTDQGATWSRKLPPVNSQVEYGARYPTLALRIDSGAAASTAKAFTLFSQISMIPEVDHGAAIVSDIMNATSTSVVFNSMSGISSTKSCWASDVNGYFYWIGMGAGLGDILLKRTSDLVTVQSFPMFNAADIGSVMIPLRGVSHKGKLYFGFLAKPPAATQIQTYLPAFVTSTDNGETWSRIQWADFRQAIGLSRFNRLWDWNPSNGLIDLGGDMAVSYDGKVHFALGLQDTNQTVTQGRNAIVDLCQEGSYWTGFIAGSNLSDISYTKLMGPAAGQMGYSVNIAAAKNMGVYAVSWVHPTGNTPADTLCDIWLAPRLDGMYFMSAMNLTNTPGMNENNHHLSGTINFQPGFFRFRADVIYNYPAGYSGHFPNNGGHETMPSVIYHTVVDIPIPLSPVELVSFTATPLTDGIRLDWQTATESNNHIFIVERNTGSGFAEIGSVAGSGTRATPRSYSYTDNAGAGGAFYRLKQVDFDGSFTYSNEVEAPALLPSGLVLEQNHPNPFSAGACGNPGTVIRYALPVAGYVKLEVFSTLGEKVASLIDGYMEAGEQSVVFDATKLTSGIYFYRLVSGSFVETRKMILVK